MDSVREAEVATLGFTSMPLEQVALPDLKGAAILKPDLQQPHGSALGDAPGELTFVGG